MYENSGRTQFAPTKKPPSDEGGVFLRSEKTEGENRITLQIIFSSSVSLRSPAFALLRCPKSKISTAALRYARFIIRWMRSQPHSQREPFLLHFTKNGRTQFAPTNMQFTFIIKCGRTQFAPTNMQFTFTIKKRAKIKTRYHRRITCLFCSIA